jgi:hypothetical protein
MIFAKDGLYLLNKYIIYNIYKIFIKETLFKQALKDIINIDK